MFFNFISMKNLYKFNILSLALTFLVFLTGCIQPSGSGEKGITATADETDFTSLVESWNKANSDRNSAALVPLYAESVDFYGTRKEVVKVLDNKKSFFSKNPDFSQNIVGDIQIETLSSGEKKCSFVKRVKLKGKETEYPSYLVFANEGGSWKINTEGDEVTDANLAKRNRAAKSGDSVEGDFNGDGVKETVWLVPPKIKGEEGECIGDCISYLRFSNPSLAEIAVTDCIGGLPDNLGDLDGDGSDEIGLLPYWFTSCWSEYYVWTFIHGSWKYMVDPIVTHCNLWDEGTKPIVRDSNKLGYVIIHYSEFQETDIVTRSKSVHIN
jgi:hypothetical protein